MRQADQAGGVGGAPTQRFTVLGLFLVVLFLVAMTKGATGKLVVSFLGVLLLSMVLLNWERIEPLIIREG